MAAKLNLEDDNVMCREMTVAEAQTVDEAVMTKLEEWLDEAQCNVAAGVTPDSYLIIRVTK